MFNFLAVRPKRSASRRVEIAAHALGFSFCALGLLSEPALVGGLFMLLTAYLFRLLLWQGDKYGIWFDNPEGSPV